MVRFFCFCVFFLWCVSVVVVVVVVVVVFVLLLLLLFLFLFVFCFFLLLLLLLLLLGLGLGLFCCWQLLCWFGCRSKLNFKLFVNPDKRSRFHLNPKGKGFAFHASTAGGK